LDAAATEDGRVTVNLLIVHNGPDVAGGGINLKRAFDACAPGWNARAVRRKDNWLKYPGDITWLKGEASSEVMELYRQADVVMIVEKPEAINLFPPGKPYVVYHTGSRYRNDPDGVSAACRGALEVAGSLDLMLRPNLAFLPIVTNVNELAMLTQCYRPPSGTIRIAHAPTNRSIKSTDAIVQAVKRLKRRYDVSLDLIERVPWKTCLERKAQSDIFVDETTFGYGANAVECWAMGIPVVSGIADQEHRQFMLAEFGALPFVETDEAGLHDTIERLVVSPAARREAAIRGVAHVNRWHSQQAVVDMAIPIFELAMTRDLVAVGSVA
jgi:hypothetical protein